MWLKPAFKKLEEVHDDSWSYWTNQQPSSTFQSPAVFTSRQSFSVELLCTSDLPRLSFTFQSLLHLFTYSGHLMRRPNSLEKTLMKGKIEGRRRKGGQRMRWLDGQLNGHEFEKALGDGEKQGSLACCSSWGHKELDMTERLNNSNHS